MASTTRNSEDQQDRARKWRFPSAITVLLVVTILVWLLAFIIPTGAYQVDDEGRPVPGSYEQTDTELGFTDRLMDLFMAPVNGLYGIQSAETGFIGPYEVGELFGAAGVFFFVLAIGMFITMCLQTGAIQNGVAHIAKRYGNRGMVVIALLMFVFSIGGTTMGMAEETLGFYALVIPLMLSLGYDRMVAAGTILIGATVGVLASTVNPFATGVASDAADISIGDGIGFRLLMYVVLVPVGIIFVIRYARKVKADPGKSKTSRADGDDAIVKAGVGEIDPLTGKHKIVLGLIALTFAFMIYSLVPWAQIFEGTDAESYGWQLDWYFPELAALFLVMSLIVGIIGGLGEGGVSDTLVKGAGDFISVGLIIVMARGVTVVMNNAEITDTVLNAMEGFVADTTSWFFGGLMFVINIPLAFLVPSTSGHATLAMPILAPLGDFAGVSRAMVITAYQSASGLVNLITPTSAVVMGGLALAKVRYDHWLRFIAPLLGILFVLCVLLVGIGAAIS